MKFSNPFVKETKRSLYHVFLWLLGYYRQKNECQEAPLNFSYPEPTSETTAPPSVQWIGHATFLIEIGGKAFLTDPIWSMRASPFSFIGPKRHLPPGRTLETLPVVDAVFISHNHYDHLDLTTCLELKKRFPALIFYVPIGVKKWFDAHAIQDVQEFSWWESTEREGIKITCVPSQHFSGRGFFDRNKSLWCGWVVQILQKRFYFAGDTGYNRIDFCEIGKRFSPIDLSLIPIGAYAPRAFMKAVHLNPSEALKVHLDCGSRLSLASHFGTFTLSDEPLSRPPYDLYLALQDKKIPHEQFQVLKVGQKISW